MAKIIDHLSQGEILAQMAEELAEAAQAALKRRRALDDSNPTPKTIPECWESLEEEIGDVMNCIDALLLEANHDVNMLETGPYPYYLKRRILGDHGHLSNENAGRLLNYILNDKLKHILLGHLSKENNYEALAYETVRFEIDQGDTPYKAKDFPIEVAKRDEMSQIINL